MYKLNTKINQSNKSRTTKSRPKLHQSQKKAISTTKSSRPSRQLRQLNSKLSLTSLKLESPFTVQSFQPKKTFFTQIMSMTTSVIEPTTALATLGIGCYWGTENYYRKTFSTMFPNSIVDIKVGFMGGKIQDPSYRQVCSGNTGHVEVAQIEFDTKLCSYSDIVKFSFSLHDCTTPDRQGGDVGTQYASVIFYHDEEQQQIAEDLKKKLQTALNAQAIKFKRAPFESNIVSTKIVPAEKFYTADEAHQMYLIKNEGGYCNHSVRFLWDEQPCFAKH